METPQCAGAAIFRGNIGWQFSGHVKISELPPDRELVFSSFAEFLAHHRRMSIERAQTALSLITPQVMTINELHRNGVAVH